MLINHITSMCNSLDTKKPNTELTTKKYEELFFKYKNLHKILNENTSFLHKLLQQDFMIDINREHTQCLDKIFKRIQSNTKLNYNGKRMLIADQFAKYLARAYRLNKIIMNANLVSTIELVYHLNLIHEN